jgi:hypothetical protein
MVPSEVEDVLLTGEFSHQKAIVETRTLKASTAQIECAAEHDYLPSLSNRRFFDKAMLRTPMKRTWNDWQFFTSIPSIAGGWPEALHDIGGIVIFHPLMLGHRRACHLSGISEREWFLEMSSHCEKIELAICGHCRQIIFIANAAFEHRHDDTCKFVAAEICLGTPIQQQRRLIVSTLHDLPVRGRKNSSVSI